MFFCIGENYISTNACGKGDTIEKAIIDWSARECLSGVADEFEKYRPKIINGKSVLVSVSSETKLIIDEVQ